MAEFIVSGVGDGSYTKRNGTKASGATGTVQSWHGSISVRLFVQPGRPKPSAPTAPDDIMVQIRVEEGSHSQPSRLIFDGQLSDLLSVAEHQSRLQLPLSEIDQEPEEGDDQSDVAMFHELADDEKYPGYREE